MLEEVNVVYEDNHLLVINKPAGLLTQPVPQDNRPSLEEEAKTYLKEKYNKPGRVFLNAVHRIDRQVSGLVLFARTDKALSRLNKAMREGKIDKTYQALVEGKLSVGDGQPVRLRHFLSHSSFHASVSNHPQKGYRESLLDFRVLHTTDNSTLIEIDLKTGRYHQIRAQMSYIGHPIIGDSRYGSMLQLGSSGEICLLSASLYFIHPVKQDPVELSLPTPANWFDS